MTVILHPSGRSQSYCYLVLLMLNATWPDPAKLCPSPSVHTQQREKSWSLHCKFMTVTKAAFSLPVCFSNMFFFPRFYSSYLLLGLIVTLWLLRYQGKGKKKKRKGKQRGLVSKVQAVLFPLHGPMLKVFHCQGYKQLFTGISGWEYSISSQWHYFVCLGMQAL